MSKRAVPDITSVEDSLPPPTKKYSTACYCPITHSLMKDPVQDTEGNSFERSAIEAWLRGNPTSPITRTPMTLGDLTLNRVLAAITNNLPETSIPTALVELIEPPVVQYSTEMLLDVLAHELDIVFENFTPDHKVDIIVTCKPMAIRKKTRMLMVIDVSGSIITEAKKDTGLSILDIVKQAAKMTTAYMEGTDSLGLVEFSCKGKVLMPMVSMTEHNKKSSNDAVDRMFATGGTNL